MIPAAVRAELRRKLWELADELRWEALSLTDKSRYYEVWTRDPNIGGTLARFMDAGKVRVYLKDTLLKDYGRQRMAHDRTPLAVVAATEADVVESYIKPHGRRLVDGRVICWGRADDWKNVLMALHERTFRVRGAAPFAAVLLSSDARYGNDDSRRVVLDAAKKLGIQQVFWR